MSRRTIAIDIGNSRIKFGLLASLGSKDGEAFPVLQDSLAIRLEDEIPWQRLRNWVDQASLGEGDLVVASVNPPALKKLLSEWPVKTPPRPYVVDGPSKLKLAVNVDAPERVGIDRLLNAVAANRIRVPGQPLIVVDSGTATTVDLIDSEGVFSGGAILAGVELHARSLHEYTALLPLLSLPEIRSEPPSPLGKNTRDAIRSGIFWGQVGAIRELVERLTKSFSSRPALVVTGGAARMLMPHLPVHANWVPHLGLYGMVTVIEQRNETP